MRSRKTDYSTFKHNVMNEGRSTRESPPIFLCSYRHKQYRMFGVLIIKISYLLWIIPYQLPSSQSSMSILPQG